MFGWLRRKPISAGPSESDDIWYALSSLASSVTASGMLINATNAMRITTVSACVNSIAHSIASLPVVFYRKNSDGTKERLDGYRLAPLFRESPNEYQSAQEWTEYMIQHCALRGNAFAEIVPGARGAVDQLIPLPPDKVEIKIERGRVRYSVTTDGGKRDMMPEQIFHLRGPALDEPYIGYSRVALHAETFGLALAAQEYAARYFQNDARAPAYIEYPSSFPDEEAFKKFRDKIQIAGTGKNRGKIGILSGGATIKQLEISNRDAQFIELQIFLVAEICRIFNVPPHVVQHLEKSTFANIEHQAIQFVTQTLMPWIVRLEQRIKKQLIVEDDIYCELTADGLLRGDAKTRNEAYAVAVINGWMTRNEVRRKENMSPLDGLDAPLQPLNMTSDAAGDEESTDGDQEQDAPDDRMLDEEAAVLQRAYESRGVGAFKAWTRSHNVAWQKRMVADTGCSPIAAARYCTAGYEAINSADDIGAVIKNWKALRLNDWRDAMQAERAAA